MQLGAPAIKWIAKGYKAVTRRKSVYEHSPSRLAKVLSTFDLTTLGIGSTLGIGIYVIAGQVAKNTAGPGVALSFLIAGAASLFAGLCYAEIGPRVPKAGSAYNYSYVTIGEFMAFFIGWNMILEYSIGAASVAKSFSEYLDSILGYPMRNFFTEYVPISVQGLSQFPDVFAFGITMVFAIAIAYGARESSFFTNIFTVINVAIIAGIILAGTFQVNSSNWQLPAESIPPGFGVGGFMPYGFSGVLRGAAICFYGFIGFDAIGTAGEEAKYPRRSIPLAFCISLAIIFLGYLFMSMILTMMIPYYDEDTSAPLLYIFRQKGWTVGEYFVMVGAAFGLCASLVGSMYPLPRVIFAMAADGLVFKFMGKIHKRHKTPFLGTLLTGFITSLIAMFFDLTQLIHMMSIGTLLAYTMVSCSVMILRYSIDEQCVHRRMVNWDQINDNLFKKLCNYDSIRIASNASSNIATWGCALFCVLSITLGVILNFYVEDQVDNNVWVYISIGIGVIMFLVAFFISRQPRSRKDLAFRTPYVPWVPAASIFINLYLTIKLDSSTWIRFLVWIIIGLLIYFCYGVWNSNERKRRSQHQNGNGVVRRSSLRVPVITISETIM